MFTVPSQVTVSVVTQTNSQHYRHRTADAGQAQILFTTSRRLDYREQRWRPAPSWTSLFLVRIVKDSRTPQGCGEIRRTLKHTHKKKQIVTGSSLHNGCFIKPPRNRLRTVTAVPAATKRTAAGPAYSSSRAPSSVV